ncbi:MAG: phospho-N-acetylmuramoyl-pentapeptide-transferase [Bacillota bacterium]
MTDLALAAVVAGMLVVASGPFALPYLRRLKLGQVVRADGPGTHLKKAGTPTMGGVLFLAAALLTTAAFGRIDMTVSLAAAMAAGNALLGFADDYLKVVKRRPLGLKARHKLAFQVALAALLAAGAAYLGLGTGVRVPFTDLVLPLGPSYPVLVILVMLGTTNAVNFTDGVDGLLGTTGAIALVFYSLVAIAAGRYGLALFLTALAGGLAGFLFYNWHPARVFMGDTGSLGIGGALGAAAVLTRTELLLPVAGGVFVLVTLSVIIQVVSFRSTGRRLLKMAPIHHHFELMGWPERTIVIRFALAGVAFALLALVGLKGLGM